MNSQEATARETSTAEVVTEEIEEDSEVETVTEEMVDLEAEMIEDPEEILVIDPRDASTAARTDTLPEIAQNVLNALIFKPESQEISHPETETTETEMRVTEEEAEAEAVTDTRSTEREAHQAQAEADLTE